MSLLGKIGLSTPYPADKPGIDVPQLQIDRFVRKADADPIRDKALVTGTTDTTRALGSPLTDGITLAAGASVNIPHNLGRKAAGFIPLICPDGGGVGSLIYDQANLSSDLRDTHIRVKNAGGASCTFKALVL